MRYTCFNTAATPLLLHAQPWRLFFGRRVFGMATLGPVPFAKPALAYAAQAAQLIQRGMVALLPIYKELCNFFRRGFHVVQFCGGGPVGVKLYSVLSCEADQESKFVLR